MHPQKIQLNGELGTRAALTIKRLQSHPFDDVSFVVQDVARVPDLKRRFEEYEGDVSGRTLGSWSYISRITGEHPKKLDILAKEILKHQSAAGFFGKDQQKIDWDYWGRQTFGHGRLLGGLVQYYKLTGNDEILQSAIKLGNYFCESIGTWTTTFDENPWTTDKKTVNWISDKDNRQHFVKTHMTSILESLVMLNEISSDEKYLEASKKILPLFPEFGQYHAHSYLNTMAGMAMLYYHTGDSDVYKRLMSLYWQDVVAHGQKREGIGWEWFPHDHRTEGCTITDWIRVNLYLWKATLDLVYLQAAENAWYNTLYFHQTGQGAFGHTVMNEHGFESQFAEAWWCCLMHGLWAFAEIANFAAVEDQDNVWINFYEPADIMLKTAKINIISEYPQEGKIVIKIQPNKKEFAVHLRIPEWVEKVEILVNDSPAQVKLLNGYATIERSWKKNDTIKLNFPIQLRLVDEFDRNYLELRTMPTEAVSAYFCHGPLILGATKTPNSVFPTTIFFDRSKNYRIAGEAKDFILPHAHYMLPMTFDPDIKNVVSTVNLAPMSERTADTQWQPHLQGYQRNGETPIQRPGTRILHSVKIK